MSETIKLSSINKNATGTEIGNSNALDVNVVNTVPVPVSINSFDSSFELNGVSTKVSMDTNTPANSTPMPIIPLDASGNVASLATEATLLDVETELQTANATLSNILGIDFATDQTSLAIESQLQTANASLTSIAAEDFATETTLQSVDAELQSANATLTSLDSKDFATETTLQSIDGKDFATETTLQVVAGKDFATETTLQSLDGKDFATETTLQSIASDIADIKALSALTVVDFMDTPVLNAANTTINGSAGAFVEVVAALAADVKKIRVADTTGAFIGVYTGAPSAETLAFIVNPGQSNECELAIASGERVSVRAMAASDITEGELCIQFLG